MESHKMLDGIYIVMEDWSCMQIKQKLPDGKMIIDHIILL